MDSNGDRAYVPQRKRRRTLPQPPTPANIGQRQAEAAEAIAVAARSSPPAEALPPSKEHEEAPRGVDAAVQEAQWARLESGISVAGGGETVAPMYSFEAMHLPLQVIRTLQARKIETPTAVQAQAIPCISTGRDIVTLAATGSGKTLCYLLPLLARADQHRHIGSLVPVASAVAMPFALILVPTRELMDQVLHELLSFLVVPSPQTSSFEPVSAFGLCGGISVQMQTSWLRAHSMQLQVVVATPGRLLRMLELAVLSLNRLTFLVIDEVDRILETEMEHQVRQILTTHANTSLHRQTLLFSATLPHFMDRIVRSTVVDPITIRVGMGAQGTGTVASSSTAATLRELPLVSQDVVFLRFAEKKSRLLEVLRATPYPPVLVFCNSHESVDFVTRVLQREQFHVASLHGEHSQSYRFQVMSAFRAGAVDVLVATDLASRGLDFDTVDHVVIFDMPHTIEDYVHRCGRTGRRRESTTEGDRRATGKVTAFLTIECGIAADLKRVLEETRQPVPLELAVPSRFHSPPQ